MAKTTYSETTGDVAKPAAPAKPVPIVDPGGRVVEVDGVDLDQAIAAGSRVATPEDVAAQKAADRRALPISDKLRERGWSDTAASLAGGAAEFIRPFTPASSEEMMALHQGALEGATGGFGQVGVKAGIGALFDDHAADTYAKEVQRIREEYPTLRTAGNVGGMLAAAAVGGATGIGTIAGAVEGATGRGLAQLGIAGEGALARAGIAAAKGAAGGLAEGAVFGAAQEASEETLSGSPELNAQKIAAAGLHGGLYGALFGGALSGGGSLAASGVKGGVRMLAEHSGTLRELADHQLWKALDPASKFTKEAEVRVAGGTKGVGKVLDKYKVTGETLGDAFSGGYAEEMLPKITAAKEQVGKAIGEIHSTPATVKMGDIEDALEKVIAPNRGKAGFESLVSSLEGYKKSLGGQLGMAEEVAAQVRARNLGKDIDITAKEFTPREAKILKEAHAAVREAEIPVQKVIEQRKALDELVYREAKALDPNLRVGFMRDIRAGLEDRIVNSIDAAATKAGNPEVAANLRTLKHDYQALSLAESAAENSTASYKTNRNVSLSGQLAGAAMVASGNGLMAIPVAVGHQIIKTRGNAMASVALRRLADMGDAMRAIQQTNAKLESAAKGLVGAGGPYRSSGKALPPGDSTPLRTRYANAVKEVTEMKANAGKIAEAVASAPPMPAAPKLSGAIAAQALRSVGYLASKLPPTNAQPTLGGPNQAPKQSTQAMQRFVDTFDAVKNPDAVFDQMARGRVNREYALALKNSSPELFQELQRQTLEQVAARQEAGKPLSLHERLRLGIVLEIPTDPVLQPATMNALQSAIASSTVEESGRPAPPRPSGASKPAPDNGIDKIETL